MIQRIQSLYLLIVVTLSCILLFIPIAEVYPIKEFGGILLIEPRGLFGFITLGLWTIYTLIALSSIFLFKNRRLQMRMGNINMFINVFAIGAMISLIIIASQNGDGELVWSIQFGSIIPLITLVLTWLANKSIKKDDDLIRSVDRLR